MWSITLELMSKIDMDTAVGSRQPQPDQRIVQRKGLQSLLGIIVVAGVLVLVAKVEAWPDHGHASHLAFAQHTAILQIAQGLFDREIRENAGVERNPAIAEQPRPPVKNRRWIGNRIRLTWLIRRLASSARFAKVPIS